MKKTREIIRLKSVCNLSKRKISSSLKVSRPVITRTLESFQDSGLSYGELESMSDTDPL